MTGENQFSLPGEAGSGNSYTIKSIVNCLVAQDIKVLVAAPTGFLASVFRATLPDEVECETIHASFYFPVESDTPPTINWQLANYDILIIDELSMIANVIFEHMLKTLNVLLFRPVIMLCGDAGQQQPFSRANRKIMQLTSAFDNTSFINSTYCYSLKEQHRVGDADYLSFLNTIRKWVPTQHLLDEIQEGRVISDGDSVTEDNILTAYHLDPQIIIVTFTKKGANYVNTIISRTIFQKEQPLDIIQLDCHLPPIPIYFGMRVVITQNRDKANGIVNGQLATIHTVQAALYC